MNNNEKKIDERSLFTSLVFKDSDKISEFGKINIMDPRMKKPLLHTSQDNSFSLVLYSLLCYIRQVRLKKKIL